MSLSLDLRTMETALAVAEAGTVAGAAALLYASPTVVSRRISALERHVGRAVFTRGPGRRRVEVTPAGHAVLARIRQIMADIGSLAAVAQAGEAGTDRVRMGFLGIGLADMGESIVAYWRTLHPHVLLDVVALDGYTEGTALEGGWCDVVVTQLTGAESAADVVIEETTAAARAAIVPARSDLADAVWLYPGDLADAPWMGVTAPERMRRWMDDLPVAEGSRLHRMADPATVAHQVAATGLVGLSGIASATAYAAPGAVYVPLAERPVVYGAMARADDERPAVRDLMASIGAHHRIARAAVGDDGAWPTLG